MVFGKLVSGSEKNEQTRQVADIRSRVLEEERGLKIEAEPEAFCMYALAYEGDTPVATGGIAFDGESYRIQEVAVLFIGIFITMQPALMILKAKGAELGITEPFQMFWATGFLSSFLDNTPTYLVFLTTAGSLGFTEGMQTILGTVPVAMLEAISCGAVFMGANTYIGNAPNFMVKAISDENGIKMPSFFGYLMWSIAFLVPVFLLDMLVFFL